MHRFKIPLLEAHNHTHSFWFPAPTPPNHLTLLFLISCKRANIFPVFARLDPHLIKLAHYVALWLVEGNQLFNSQTWAAGAGGAQRAAHLIPRTLISYKAKLQLSVSLPPHPPSSVTANIGHWVWGRQEEESMIGNIGGAGQSVPYLAGIPSC